MTSEKATNRLCRGRRMRRAFMIFAGSGKRVVFRAPCMTEGGGASFAVSSGLRGRLHIRFPGLKNNEASELWTLPLPTGKGSHLPRRAVRRRPRGLCRGKGGGGGASCRRSVWRRGLPAAHGPFRGEPASRSLFFGAARFCAAAGEKAARSFVPLTGRTLAFTPERNEVFRRPHGYFFLVSRSGAVPRPA